MTLRKLVLASALALGVACTTLVGCDFILTPTKTATGQLYQSGDGRYDPYFAHVHREQVAADSWPDDAKAARRPITTALDLRPNASNATILGATRDKKGERSLASAVTETTSAEGARARRLTATAAKLDDLRKRGEALKEQATQDRKNLAADKADDKEVERRSELRREMASAVDVVESLASAAHKGAKEAEELAAKLEAAWTGLNEDERPPVRNEERRDEQREEQREAEPVVKKAPKSSPAPGKSPAANPAKPAPASKPPAEVFNP